MAARSCHFKNDGIIADIEGKVAASRDFHRHWEISARSYAGASKTAST
ncbi:hypothetical protein [Mesorhizobium sp. ArgA1]